MLKNQDIICISSIDWDFIWQAHQSIMSTFARNGNRILFIENTGVRSASIKDASRLKKRLGNWLRHRRGFRVGMENIWVYSPLILPFPYFRIARVVNKYLLTMAIKKWMKTSGVVKPIIWTFLPTPIALDVSEAIQNKAFIYYCMDNFAATSKSARKVANYEKEVLGSADAVFVLARNMIDYCRTYNDNVTCIPMGVDTGAFKNTDTITEKPEEIVNIDGPIIGYIGGIRATIDQELVGYLAKELAGHTFVFVGPIQTDISYLRQFNNIIFTDRKPHSELPRYLKYFDACIVPYKKDDYTDNVSLAKLNEYLIMGKPVISTNLKETENFNRDNNGVLEIADSREKFLKLLLESIKNDNDILRKSRIEIADRNGWDDKIEQMSGIIENIGKYRS